jgi:hypothetical protein
MTCGICNGMGWVRIPDDPYGRAMCRCTLENLYRKKLGPEIFNAQTIKESDFLEKVNKNLFIRSGRKDFLPHLRFCLIKQGLNFPSRVTNDLQMLDAWLSRDREHTKANNPDSVTFTSLSDLVEEPKLVVIFLGVLSYPNKAMPGVLLEGIKIRHYADRPTWVVNPYHLFFEAGNHLCYSIETEEYLKDNFESVTLHPEKATAPLHDPRVVKQSGSSDKALPASNNTTDYYGKVIKGNKGKNKK